MRYTISIAILVIFAVITKVSSVPQPKIDGHARIQDLSYGGGKPCKCMNWRSCTGEINSDVPCEQSYIDVCCVLPQNKLHKYVFPLHPVLESLNLYDEDDNDVPTV